MRPRISHFIETVLNMEKGETAPFRSPPHTVSSMSVGQTEAKVRSKHNDLLFCFLDISLVCLLLCLLCHNRPVLFVFPSLFYHFIRDLLTPENLPACVCLPPFLSLPSSPCIYRAPELVWEPVGACLHFLSGHGLFSPSLSPSLSQTLLLSGWGSEVFYIRSYIFWTNFTAWLFAWSFPLK